MSDISVVKMPNKVLWNDIPGKLRQLADAFEGNEQGMPETVYVLIVDQDGKLNVKTYGHAPINSTTVGVLTMAAHLFME